MQSEVNISVFFSVRPLMTYFRSLIETSCIRSASRRVVSVCLKDTTPDELLSAAMTAVLTQVGLPAQLLGDVCVGESWISVDQHGASGSRMSLCSVLSPGNVLQPGAGAVMARVAHFLR